MQLDDGGQQQQQAQRPVGNLNNNSTNAGMTEDDYMVLCCVCGILIPTNPTNMCVQCVQSHINITRDLIKEYILTYCPECDRYLQPPKLWTRAPLESRELMTICLKKVKGLAGFHLADAQFLWTEAHSKRVKLALTLQKELFANAVVQQTFHVEFIVQWRQCEFCAKVATGQPQWDAVVQVRQKTEHKRTMLFLEQLVLKHRMHENAISIEAHPEGMDFYFSHRSHGMSFVDFVMQNSPARRQDAVQLVSHDSKSNVAVQHHAYSIEVAPLCREDLVCLPKALYTAFGAFGPIVLVHKIFSTIVFIDPTTLRAQQIEGTLFWKNPFTAFANTKRLVNFFVLSIDKRGVVNGRLQQADITVCLEEEVGGERQWTVRSHLGGVLKEGDLVKGYHVAALNPNNDYIGQYPSESLPDVVLVHKHFENQAARRAKRAWDIRVLDVVAGRGTGANRALAERDAELEAFKDDLERDKEYRKDVPLYFNPMSQAAHEAAAAKRAAVAAGNAAAAAAAGAKAPRVQEVGDDDDEDEAMVDLAELIDELQVSDQPGKRSRDQDNDDATGEDDEDDGGADDKSGFDKQRKARNKNREDLDEFV